MAIPTHKYSYNHLIRIRTTRLAPWSWKVLLASMPLLLLLPPAPIIVCFQPMESCARAQELCLHCLYFSPLLPSHSLPTLPKHGPTLKLLSLGIAPWGSGRAGKAVVAWTGLLAVCLGTGSGKASLLLPCHQNDIAHVRVEPACSGPQFVKGCWPLFYIIKAQPKVDW